MEPVDIPMDIYESQQEIVILIPLGGMRKDSLKISLENYKLTLEWERVAPLLKENLVAVQQDCYRGVFSKTIDLPPQVYFDQIHSNLSTDNILTIVVPKIIVPDRVEVEIEK